MANEEEMSRENGKRDECGCECGREKRKWGEISGESEEEWIEKA